MIYTDNENIGVFLVGDCHGFFSIFNHLKRLYRPGGDVDLLFIQVGDLGYWPIAIDAWPVDMPWPVYFIDGNHDYYPWLRDIKEITEVRNNLFFVPRGSTMEIGGKTFGFMGGAFSVDKMQRKEGVNWWADEEVRESDIQKLIGKHIDVLVTHSPPANVIYRNFGSLNKRMWRLPDDALDTSSIQIENLWGELGMPQLFCGHMHRSVQDRNCRILDINEVIQWKSLAA